jgi:hypothetical protein
MTLCYYKGSTYVKADGVKGDEKADDVKEHLNPSGRM